MSENVGASTSRKPKGLHGLYRNNFTFFTCSRDATTVRVIYTYGGSSKELTVTSAYLPYAADEPPPTRK
jgi:hypothetical protein